MRRKPHVVIGLGFGDEGKGATVDRLVRDAGHGGLQLVVRFSGGHQAGHTVVHEDGRRHVFSQVGSGALRGAGTLWSRHCTLEPVGFGREHAALSAMGAAPLVYVDPRAPLVTPYDIAHNRAAEESRGGGKHGSCGLGFAATLDRHALLPLYAMDIQHPRVLAQKMALVREHYKRVSGGRGWAVDRVSGHEEYLSVCEATRDLLTVKREDEVLNMATSVVFEGSQGVMLDMDHGFFPHVTKSRCTSRTAIEMCREYGLPEPVVDWVTRAYQTRHGRGPMSNEGMDVQLRGTEGETNVTNPWQEGFRTAVLDGDLLLYAAECDRLYSRGMRHNLVVTCRDQVRGPIMATFYGEAEPYDAEMLGMMLQVDETWCPEGASAEKLRTDSSRWVAASEKVPTFVKPNVTNTNNEKHEENPTCAGPRVGDSASVGAGA